ncbi:hypothetical protein Goe24_01300 [Bacillus phage vB_BsuM-Goe24]|nr:hypothetical protein Goe7_c01300 [Bacillus phage vB_BveM-Goe7]WCS69505.1 hypothetical protein Goe24_01300 [Bacillus phage vB_BsuM-Goe24]
MSFQDLINAETKKLESRQGGEGVKYPQTKHDRLFFGKNSPQHVLQILPAADLASAFAIPTRKIFLTTKSSQGKEIKANFTLDADENPGSLLEQKITEWAGKQMIPSGFGGQQSPRVVYLLNVVKIVQLADQTWTQERDAEGNLVVRLLELPQSGYRNLLNKLKDPLCNVSGTVLSFMDINKAAAVRISKPAPQQMEYPVDIYPNIILPPLGQGWEAQLEDLHAHAVPTERLENGADWVQAFIDMKEGRKPNGGGNSTASAANPFAQQQPNTFAQQPAANPFAQQQPNTFAQSPVQNPTQNPLGQQQQPDPFAQQQPQQQADPFAQQQQPNLAGNPAVQPGGTSYTPPQPPTQQPDIQMPTGMEQAPPQGLVSDPLPTDFGVPVPQQSEVSMPETPSPEGLPAHNLPENANGLADIDAMLDKELNG